MYYDVYDRICIYVIAPPVLRMVFQLLFVSTVHNPRRRLYRVDEIIADRKSIQLLFDDVRSLVFVSAMRYEPGEKV